MLRHYFIRLGFIQDWKEIAAVGFVQETFDTLERALNAVVAKHGELALTIPLACFVAQKQVNGPSDSNSAAAEDISLK